MKLRQVPRTFFTALVDLADILFLLYLFGFIPEPIFHGASFLMPYSSYFVVLALGLALALTLWLGYQIRALLEKGQARDQYFISFNPHSYPQLAYRTKVRNELSNLVFELFEFNPPKVIQFKSWNAFLQPDTRFSDINNQGQYQAIQNLSTVLNQRNDYVNGKSIDAHQDSEFLRLNNTCIEMYENVRNSGFLELDFPVESQGTLRSYEELIRQEEPVSHYPIIGTRRARREPTALDEQYSHLQAYMFYPFWYYIPILSKLMGKHRDLYPPPRKRLIVNKSTKRALPLRGVPAISLTFPIMRIAWNPERESFPYSNLNRWCKKRGWNFDEHWTPTQEDLAKREGPIQSWV